MKKNKHVFPDDWGKISDKEAIKHIEYLLEHYQEYDMSKFGDNGIIINEIYFYPSNISLQHGVTFKYMIINMQKVYGSTKDIYPMIQQLIDVCHVEINKRKTEKAKAKKIAKVDTVIGATVICGLFIWGMIFIADQLPNILKMMENLFKTNKVENTAQQQSLPKDNEYVLTQQQIQNYRDTLKQVVK